MFHCIFKLGAEIVNTAFLLQEYQDKDTGKAKVQDRMFFIPINIRRLLVRHSMF